MEKTLPCLESLFDLHWRFSELAIVSGSTGTFKNQLRGRWNGSGVGNFVEAVAGPPYSFSPPLFPHHPPLPCSRRQHPELSFEALLSKFPLQLEQELQFLRPFSSFCSTRLSDSDFKFPQFSVQRMARWLSLIRREDDLGNFNATQGPFQLRLLIFATANFIYINSQ